MCQKAFGNWCAAFVEVSFANLRWQGESPDVFRSSSRVQSLFCRHCGTPLGMQEDGDDTIDIAAASLDDPSSVVFSRQIGIGGRLAWFAQLHLLPEVKTQDTRPAAELARLKSNQHKDERLGLHQCFNCRNCSISLAAIRATGLGHLGTTATPFAAHGSRSRLHQSHRIVCCGAVWCDPDHN